MGCQTIEIRAAEGRTGIGFGSTFRFTSEDANDSDYERRPHRQSCQTVLDASVTGGISFAHGTLLEPLPS
jgi:hypothetical protein